ncbi:azurin [Dyadobacter tibetensis]|uniref:azurin n=1 Tax=Dyadobacter tibetensis TaxID=1211851 RepID=UPI000472A450|nr:azurin [Dyadobacter tibetensis]
MKKLKTGMFLFASVLALTSLNTNAFADKPVTEIVDSKQVKTIEIKGTDAMQFDLKEIKVKAGQKVKLKLTHAGKLAKAAMGHNWVLLKEGVDVAAFGSKAAAARDNEYIPKSEEASIIAHTKLLGGGESDTIEFTAPKKGKYTYICSFPGHYALMKGTFIVE